MSGLFSRLFRRPREQRRAGGDFFYPGFAGLYGSAITAREAEMLSATVACIELVAGALSSLPAELVVDSDAGTVPAPPTASGWRVIKRPNDQQSWASYMAWTAGQLCLFGNATSWVVTDQRGAPASLVPLPFPWILPFVVNGTEGGARLVYDVVQSSPETVLFGVPRRLAAEDVLHVRMRSDTGLLGRSPLSRAPDVVREALEIQATASSLWKNGLRPSAILKSPAFLTDAQRERFNDSWMQRLIGSMAAGRVPIVEGGFSLEAMSVKSVDAEFSEQRSQSIGAIARLLNVPEQLIMPGPRAITDMSTYQTLFCQQCLLPLIASIESEFDHRVLPDGQHLKIDAAGLMRGSFSAATSAMVALVQSGIVSVNEARESLDWSEHGDPEADSLRVGSPPSFPADFKGGDHLGPSPGPSDGTPELPSHGNQGRQGNGKVVLQ